MTHQQDRKGARSRADIPVKILEQLNRGEIETKTLSEALAINFPTLLRSTWPEHEYPELDDQLGSEVGFMERNRRVGKWLAVNFDRSELAEFQQHSSDMVRGWLALAVGNYERLTTRSCLKQIRVFADDDHFGVREFAWMAARPHLAKDIPASIDLLQPWALHKSVNIRRFAIEVLRPRGVWCAHIDELKTSPHVAEPLLDLVHQDEEKYVQDSVANWLNDASKTQPDWVNDLCERWLASSDSKSTVRICKRARRSIK